MAVFKDKLAPPKEAGRVNPKSYVKNPAFDKRTGKTLSCGDDYGVGHRTPVGSSSASPPNKGPIPFKCKCFSPEEVIGE